MPFAQMRELLINHFARPSEHPPVHAHTRTPPPESNFTSTHTSDQPLKPPTCRCSDRLLPDRRLVCPRALCIFCFFFCSFVLVVGCPTYRLRSPTHFCILIPPPPLFLQSQPSRTMEITKHPPPKKSNKTNKQTNKQTKKRNTKIRPNPAFLWFFLSTREAERSIARLETKNEHITLHLH